jgi:cell division transport system ATP-binding protein
MFSNEPVVKVQDAVISQEGRSVLDKISFEIEKGELVFLVGRTGSGKSSLLKTLYADIPLRLGEITVAGTQLYGIKKSKVPALRRKLGIIFQDFQLFHDRTVAENIFFVMKATGWNERSLMKARLAELLMRVGIGSVDSKYPHQLSGGEQQRVVIARAMINEPVLLIADEPTGNLDPEVSEGIFKLFLEINRSGTAILMATHNYDLIKNHPARILKCEEGRLIDSKTSEVELKNIFY